MTLGYMRDVNRIYIFLSYRLCVVMLRGLHHLAHHFSGLIQDDAKKGITQALRWERMGGFDGLNLTFRGFDCGTGLPFGTWIFDTHAPLSMYSWDSFNKDLVVLCWGVYLWVACLDLEIFWCIGFWNSGFLLDLRGLRPFRPLISSSFALSIL